MCGNRFACCYNILRLYDAAAASASYAGHLRRVAIRPIENTGSHAYGVLCSCATGTCDAEDVALLPIHTLLYVHYSHPVAGRDSTVTRSRQCDWQGERNIAVAAPHRDTVSCPAGCGEGILWSEDGKWLYPQRYNDPGIMSNILSGVVKLLEYKQPNWHVLPTIRTGSGVAPLPTPTCTFYFSAPSLPFLCLLSVTNCHPGYTCD